MSPYVWLVIAAVMAVVEVVSLSLITVWFVAGGLVAFAVGFAGGGLLAQAIAFLAVSLVCLLLFRPLALKHRKLGESHESTPVGQGARVVEAISADEPGRVETPDHMTWVALSANGEPLEVGARVRVTGQDSIKLIVERI